MLEGGRGVGQRGGLDEHHRAWFQFAPLVALASAYASDAMRTTDRMAASASCISRYDASQATCASRCAAAEAPAQIECSRATRQCRSTTTSFSSASTAVSEAT